MSTTQQQIEEIARNLADTMSRAIDRPLREFSDMVQEELIGHCQNALTEATQPLLERVAEMEKELQNMAHRHLEIATKSLDNRLQLQSQLITLEAACAEKDEAIKVACDELVNGENHGNISDCLVAKKLRYVINSTTCGNGMLEENERMRKALEELSRKQNGINVYGFAVHKIAKQALHPTTNERK